MRLLDIEISGFKSFANSIRIPIDKDIIGFVGPNGCGKSNIVDAIKWVIGEQNPREIRCERSGDVIFNGSSLRAAQGMAEVTLRLSNEDKKIPLNYNEIEITRRLYKNGDSEYLLNRTPVRLKDINRLLSGTGLGESSYTLFKASVIDELLSPNSMLINNILSEASGIAKYKLDKRETLKKLKLTRDAMKRGDDIIAEVTERLKTLKYQSDKARRYNKLKDEIENKEKLYLIKAYKSGEEELSSIDRQIEEIKERENGKIQRYNEIEKNRRENDAKIVELSDLREAIIQSIDSINEELNNIAAEKSTVTAEMKNLKERSQILLQEKKRLIESIPESEDNIETIKRSITAIGNEIQALNEGLEGFDGNIEEITKEIANRSIELDVKRRELEKKRESLRKKENEFEVEKRTYQFNLDKVNDLKDELDSKIEESKRMKEDLPTIEDELAENLTKEEELKKIIKDLNEKMLKVNREIENKKEELQKAESKSAALESELRILKEMEENNEGIGKEALKYRKSGKSLLMDKVEGKKGYEDLIESLLANYKDYVLLNNRDELVELTKKIISNKNAGKVNFIYKYGKENRGNLREYIKEGAEYLPQFVANTIVLNSIDDIDFNAEVPQITKDGRVFYYKNLLSVNGENNVKFIGRKKRIEEIERNIDSIGKKTGELRESIDILLSEQENLIKIINEREGDASKLSESTAEIEEKIRDFKGRISLIDSEIEDIREEISEYSVSLDDTKIRLDELKNIITIEREEMPTIEDYEKELEDLKKRLEVINKERQNTEIEKIKKENELANKEKFLEELKTGISTTKERINGIEKNLQTFAAEIEEKNKKIEEYEGKEKELYDNIEKFRAEDREYKEKINHIREEIENKQNEISNINEELESVRSEIETLKIKRESVAIKTDEIRMRLKNRYGIDAEKSDYESEEKIPSDEEIEKMKNRLQRMEPINLLALKEYEEVKERYDFLIKQRDDLLESEKSLLKTIEISDKRAKEDFEKNFSTVRENFNKLFKELFGGGKSNIVIENADDPIESKIVIYAQPPGKRVKNITMLSTGEQTLAAIALLFSIYETKPSPFCFMDEIDAPLDDANVERFIGLLRRLKEHSQILMITHNRRTMEVCEYIYGVTMEEGVSKVVSINLEKEVEEWV